MYKKRITAWKTLYPVTIIILGSKLIQLLFLKINQRLDDESAFIISSTVFGVICGMNNFLKNHKRKRYF